MDIQPRLEKSLIQHYWHWISRKLESGTKARIQTLVTQNAFFLTVRLHTPSSYEGFNFLIWIWKDKERMRNMAHEVEAASCATARTSVITECSEPRTVKWKCGPFWDWTCAGWLLSSHLFVSPDWEVVWKPRVSRQLAQGRGLWGSGHVGFCLSRKLKHNHISLKKENRAQRWSYLFKVHMA